MVKGAPVIEYVVSPLEKFSVTDVPEAATVPPVITGGPWVELFVTVNVFAIATASLPVVSWIAAFVAATSDVGGV
jgi:hypothetical protein